MSGLRSKADWLRTVSSPTASVVLAVLAVPAGCTPGPQTGGDSHFLARCGDGIDVCDGELQCICGVCTRPCEQGPDCRGLSGHTSCRDAPEALGGSCGADVERVCVAECASDTDCTAAAGGTCEDGICVQRSPTLVVLLLDSSGSMELRAGGCVCESLSCEECMPDCAAGERSRWMALSEALGGSYVEGQCTTLERTEENGATFDIGYYRDYNRPPLQSPRRDDGLLQRYEGRADFVVATFDGWDTYLGSPPLVDANDYDFDRAAGLDGCWSYGTRDGGPRTRPDGSEAGHFRYPGTPTAYMMDTGIRGPTASNGALTTTLGGADIAALVDTIARTRPWGGTPIAAALDDLDYYLRKHTGLRPRGVHVVLVSDGKPDDDYRKFGCDCTQNDDPGADSYCVRPDDSPNDGNDPDLLHCPYPLATTAARTLVCGWADNGDCDGGVADAVHVVAYGTDPEARATFDSIASAGGTAAARGTDGGDLREVLAAILDGIVQ